MAFGKRKSEVEDDNASTRAKPTATVDSTPTTQTTQTIIQEMRELNKQFSSWVEQQLSKNPCEPWIGVEDYLKYATDIKNKYDDAAENLAKSTSSNTVNSEDKDKDTDKDSDTDTDTNKNKDKDTLEHSTPLNNLSNPNPFSSLTKTGIVKSNPQILQPLSWTTFNVSWFPTPISLLYSPSSPSFASTLSSPSFTPNETLPSTHTSLFSNTTPPPDSNEPPPQTQSILGQSQSQNLFSKVFSNTTPPLDSNEPSSQTRSLFSQNQSQSLFSNVPRFIGGDNASYGEIRASPPLKSNESSLFKGRAKLFMKVRDDGLKPWKNMGMGELYLREIVERVEEEEEEEEDDLNLKEKEIKNGGKGKNDSKLKKPFLTFVNDVTRKRLLNAFLYAKMKVISKNNNLTMLLFSNHDGFSTKGSEEPEFHLIKFSDKKDAEKLKKLVEENTPKI